MPKRPFKDTVAALQKEFEARVKQADEEIPVLVESFKVIPPEFSFHQQIQDHINVLVDRRFYARHYLKIIAENAEIPEAGVSTWTPPSNRITMEPPSPEEPMSGGADAS